VTVLEVLGRAGEIAEHYTKGKQLTAEKIEIREQETTLHRN